MRLTGLTKSIAVLFETPMAILNSLMSRHVFDIQTEEDG
jgi:hypothetical protein